MSARREFQEIVGDAARARRQALGLRQDEVAWRCGLAGFAVTRSVVDAIERGARQLELPELLSLLAALDMSLADLLGGAGEVAQSGDLSVNGDVLLKQALGESPTWTITSHGSGRTFNVQPATGRVTGRGSLDELLGLRPGEAETKAARRLGVTVEDIHAAAEITWGRTLTTERDARVSGIASPHETPRRLQALRGHVTRTLLAELEPALPKVTEVTQGQPVSTGHA